MNGSDACLLMHTALRKCCDSSATSALYNLVHLCKVQPNKFSPWLFFGNLVVEHLANKSAPSRKAGRHGKPVLYALKKAHQELPDRFFSEVLDIAKEAGTVPFEAERWLYALKCTMDLFNDDDWERMGAFLSEED